MLTHTPSTRTVVNMATAAVFFDARHAALVAAINTKLADVETALNTGLVSGVEFARDTMADVAELAIQRDRIRALWC